MTYRYFRLTPRQHEEVYLPEDILNVIMDYVIWNEDLPRWRGRLRQLHDEYARYIFVCEGAHYSKFQYDAHHQLQPVFCTETGCRELYYGLGVSAGIYPINYRHTMNYQTDIDRYVNTSHDSHFICTFHATEFNRNLRRDRGQAQVPERYYYSSGMLCSDGYKQLVQPKVKVHYKKKLGEMDTTQLHNAYALLDDS